MLGRPGDQFDLLTGFGGGLLGEVEQAQYPAGPAEPGAHQGADDAGGSGDQDSLVSHGRLSSRTDDAEAGVVPGGWRRRF